MKLDFSNIKILCIGDPIIDVYYFGRVDRISPEAPVPVFVEDRHEYRCGGADNVRNQLQALGCDVAGAWQMGPWTTKTRYMVGSHQLMRVDVDKEVLNTIPSLNGFHAIVISDYAKGACTPEICQEAIKSGLPVIVDPKGKDWRKYDGAFAICPNQYELAGQADPQSFKHVILKLGAAGISYDGTTYPSVARHVFDVTGAGDTVVAVLAACVAKGIEIPTACKLANAAAGHVVGGVGTVVCPLEVLCAYAETLCESDSQTGALTGQKGSMTAIGTSLQNAENTAITSYLLSTQINTAQGLKE